MKKLNDTSNNDCEFLPFTKDAFFAFSSNVASILHEDTNGQFNRKASWVGARLAKALPNKPDGFNVNTLLDAMREALETSAQSGVGQNPPQSNGTKLHSTSTFEHAIMECREMFGDARFKPSVHLQTAYLKEVHKVAKKYKLSDAEWLSNDLIDSDVNLFLDGLDTNHLEHVDLHAKQVKEMALCIPLLKNIAEPVSYAGGLYAGGLFTDLVNRNPKLEQPLLEIASKMLRSYDDVEFKKFPEDKLGLVWTVWISGQPMSFTTEKEMILEAVDLLIECEASFSYGLENSGVYTSGSDALSCATIDILSAFNCAHLAKEYELKEFAEAGGNPVEHATQLMFRANYEPVVDRSKRIATNDLVARVDMKRYVTPKVKEHPLKNWATKFTSATFESFITQSGINTTKLFSNLNEVSAPFLARWRDDREVSNGKPVNDMEFYTSALGSPLKIGGSDLDNIRFYVDLCQALFSSLDINIGDEYILDAIGKHRMSKYEQVSEIPLIENFAMTLACYLYSQPLTIMNDDEVVDLSTTLERYVQDNFVNKTLSDAAESIGLAIVSTVNGENGYGEDIYNYVNDYLGSVIDNVLESQEKLLCVNSSKRPNKELRAQLLTWSCDADNAELINDAHANMEADIIQSLMMSELQVAVASAALTEKIANGLHTILQEVGIWCTDEAYSGESTPKIIKNALSGKIIKDDLLALAKKRSELFSC
ncbi:hypothetical protein VCHA53O466_50412 [Vibrio chagasii]|nr:hypothetical protein VCHA53O466_50412 [Vibrio chagasii]